MPASRIRRPRLGETDAVRPPGINAAPAPTHPQANIWNGVHGPNPPNTVDDRGDREHAEQEAEAGTERAAGEDEQDEHQLDAADACSGDTDGRADGCEGAEQRECLGRSHPTVESEAERDGGEGDDGQRGDRCGGLGFAAGVPGRRGANRTRRPRWRCRR